MRREIPSTMALICFEAAAKVESFARAADSLNLSQSTVSRHIAQLEGYLSEPLFIRRRQRVTLSTAGHQLLEDISPLLDAVETSILRARTASRPDGLITVGVYPTLGSRWLMPILSRLSGQTSRITINTLTYLANDELDPERIDLGIVQGDPPWRGFVDEPLMPEALVAVASPDLLPMQLSDAHELLEMRILKHVTRPLTWPIWFESQGLSLRSAPPGPTFSQFEMLIDAARRAQGIAIVPDILVRPELEAGSLIQAHPHVAASGSGYHVIVPRSRQGVARVEKMRELLLAYAAEWPMET